MKEVTFKRLRWVKGTSGIVKGCKDGYVPRGAIAGSNGTYRVVTPACLDLTVESEDGRVFTWDIIDFVRDVTGWCRLSERRFEALETAFQEKRIFDFDEKIGIVGLDDLVRSCIM